MPISFDKADEIPEALREHAKEAGGRWTIAKLPDGWGLEDIGGLKRTVSELRQERNNLQKQVAAFEGIDPAQAGEAREALEKLKAGQLRGSKEIDEFKSAVEKKMAEERAKLEARLQKRTAEARERMVKGELAPVIAKLGGSDSAEAIITLAEKFVRVEEDADGGLKASIVDASGKPRVTRRSGSSDPMGYEELIAEMREAPSTRGLFKITAAGGSGGSSQSGGSGRGAGSGQEKLSARDSLARGFAEQRAK